ncbi:MAG: hypothetical protein DMG65_03050 [Candidatus Angelobacter sp. Gp1-AA117]|nr:MAG: hypothetical protein DMG65_03050 [Candidatus Angelobacter sp. Gp1-AA117]
MSHHHRKSSSSAREIAKSTKIAVIGRIDRRGGWHSFASFIAQQSRKDFMDGLLCGRMPANAKEFEMTMARIQ